MQLIITEKPSVAKDIARVLKVSDRQNGYFQNEDYQVSWAFGHLIQLMNPDDIDPKYQKWQMSTLPIIPDVFQKKLTQQGQEQYQIIESLFQNEQIKSVICATDAGREGELIFRLIYEMAQSKLPIYRLWISSQTDQAIKEGFANLRPGDEYQGLYDSARCRSEADWLIGMNASRAYTLVFSQSDGVMSVGRVQTPVLKMIVDRYKAHIEFKSEPYYEIHAQVQHPNGTYAAKWVRDKKDRLTDPNEADQVLKAVKASPNGQILQLTQKEKAEKAPLLYDLTELQKDANRQLGLSADQTLSIMQDLYEKHKILTYPRTSSRFLSKDIEPKLKGLVQNAQSLAPYAEVAAEILAQNYPIAKRMVNDAKVTDHHAIIPTDKKANLSALNETENAIFDMVLRRFLAAFLPDCLKEHTEIMTQFAEETFKTTGTIIRRDGWRVLDKPMAKKKKGKKDAEILLPAVEKGDAVSLESAKRVKSQTKAPPLYTEAGILAAMETAGKQIDDEALREAMKDCGLGTPATRAQTLERLLQVKYIQREKKQLVPTAKGLKLIHVIQNPKLVSPELTGTFEKKLNDMVQNNYGRETYMSEIKAFTEEVVQDLKDQADSGDLPNAMGKCPSCTAPVVETPRAYSCSKWQDTGCSFVIWKQIAGRNISSEEATLLLEKNETPVLDGFKSKAGKDFSAALSLKEQKVVFNFSDKPVGKCPLCQSNVVATPKAYSCSAWKETRCGFVIWKQIAGRVTQLTEVDTLLKEGKTTVLTGFMSRAGNPFEASLALKEGKVELVFQDR